MAFVLKQKDTYKWPIPLVLPTDGGRREKQTFDGEFKRLPQSRVNEIIRLARQVQQGKTDADALEDQDAAREILVGWSGIVDDKGKDIPFSEEALMQLLEIPSVAGQIVTAWFESYDVAKRKN